MNDYSGFDALALAALVKKGDVTPVELLEGAIARIEAGNPQLNAVVYKLYDFARKTVANSTPSEGGAFAGVPFLLKDLNAPLGGFPQSFGSVFLQDFVPPQDSVFTRRLRAAGLVIAGKTNTCEVGASLACEPRLWGPTANPWNLDRTPGGSSGGAAAAVAAGIVPMAHASDGFGSIRTPAACCGLVGLKPSRGRNSFGPLHGELLAGQVTEHVVTRTVRDSAAFLDVTSGPSPGDPYAAPTPQRSFLDDASRPPRPLRIGLSRQGAVKVDVEPEFIGALEDVGRLLQYLGHEVEEAEAPVDSAEAWRQFLIIISAGASGLLRRHLVTGRAPGEGDLETVTADLLERGLSITAGDYIAAVQFAHRLGRAMGEHQERYDVVLTPALAQAPPRTGWLSMMQDPETYWRKVEAFSPFQLWFNMTGQPAMTLPAPGMTSAGTPLSVQIAARYGEEGMLFQVAAQIEEAAPWRERRPPGFG